MEQSIGSSASKYKIFCLYQFILLYLYNILLKDVSIHNRIVKEKKLKAAEASQKGQTNKKVYS